MIFEYISYFISAETSPEFMPFGVFGKTYKSIMEGFMAPISQNVISVIEFIGPMFLFILTAFIMAYGYLILAGKIQSPAKDFVFRMALISLVCFVALSVSRYRDYIITPVIHTTQLTVKVLTPDRSGFFEGILKDILTENLDHTNEELYNSIGELFGGLDIGLESTGIIIAGMIDTYSQMAAIEAQFGKEGSDQTAQKASAPPSFLTVMLVMGFVGLLITGAVMIYVTAAVLLLLNHLVLTILLTIGPLFLIFSLFKPTREYAKKWLGRLIGVILTIGIVTAVVAFILVIQKDISGYMCSTTIQLQVQMVERANKLDKLLNPNKKPDAIEITKVKDQVIGALNKLQDRIEAPTLTGMMDNAKLIKQIIDSCEKVTSGASVTTDHNQTVGYNILFTALQFLVVCMVLNRVLTESANVAASLVNASGINVGTGQEVSGGLQGVTSRASGSVSGRRGK